MSDERIYLPVCLYPHTAYRRSDVMRSIYKTYFAQAAASLVVVADDLLAYDSIVTGRFWTVEGALIKARRQGNELLRMVNRVRKTVPGVRRNSLHVWRDLTENEDFRALARAVDRFPNDDPGFNDVLAAFIDCRVQRFGWKQDPEVYAWERRYAVEEIAMSIYTTEMLGYSTEIWEKATNAGEPDPLGFLYAERNPDVRAWTGQDTTARRLRVLDLETCMASA